MWFYRWLFKVIHPILEDRSALFGPLALALATFPEKQSVMWYKTTIYKQYHTTASSLIWPLIKLCGSWSLIQFLCYLLFQLLTQEWHKLSASLTYINMGESTVYGCRVIPLSKFIYAKIKFFAETFYTNIFLSEKS